MFKFCDKFLDCFKIFFHVLIPLEFVLGDFGTYFKLDTVVNHGGTANFIGDVSMIKSASFFRVILFLHLCDQGTETFPSMLTKEDFF